MALTRAEIISHLRNVSIQHLPTADIVSTLAVFATWGVVSGGSASEAQQDIQRQLAEELNIRVPVPPHD